MGLTLYDNGWYTYFESKSTKNNLTNSGFLQYAWACLSAAFDEVKTQGGYYYGDVLGEDLLKASNCGAIAYIGCTRVGWAYVIYQPPGGYGLMDGQDILFWKNFFNGDDNYRYRPGYALYESKRNYIQEYSPNLNLEIERKVLFSTMLLGDPELLIDAIPPAAPTLVWPENNENIGSNTPNLDWNPVSDPSKPVLYKVFIDDDPNFSSVDRESPWIADDNWLVSLPLEVKTWYWRVCAKDNAGNLSDNSATRSFTVRLPGRPLLCSPKDKARTSSAPTFKWICGAGADNHRLLVDNDADFSSPRENVLLGPTDNTYSVSPENPLPEDNYWWKVIAINPAGESESEVWTFEAVSIFYRIQIDNDPDFSSPRYDDLTYDNWLYLPGENALDDGIWYWRVRTEDVYGNASTWTESFKFTVDTQAPPALSLLSPGDYTYDNNATQTFRWEEYQDPAGFENYIIQIARNPEFTDVYHENTVTENSYTHTFTEDNLFYWRVRAVDKAGNKGVWSDSWCLVVDTTPPSAPRLVSPENNSYLATGTPTFDWDPVADLSGVTYILEIDNENTFTNPLRISGIMVSQYTLTVENALADNTYYWRVQARDKSGNFGQWSEIFKFVVDTVVAKPTLLRPENNSLTNENKPLFRWSAVTDAGVAYRLRIDNDPDCLSPVYDTGFSLVDNFDNFADHPENALADGIWYWQVTARDAAGNENSSGIFRFLIDTEVSRTVLYSPADNAFLNDNTPFFDWQAIIDRSGVTYTLIIDNDPDLSSPIYCKLGLTYSDHTCENELPDGTYYWAVRVEDGAGNQSLSEKRRFVIDTAAPLTPENLQPPDGHLSNTNLPSFGWSEVENADYYELQLARDRAFTQQLRTERCYENFHRPSQPLEEGIWYWRVRALDNAGNSSGWSENRKLVVDTRVLSPRLLSPASGSYLNDNTPAFSWERVEDPSGVYYELQVSQEPTFTLNILVVPALLYAENAGGENVSSPENACGPPDENYAFLTPPFTLWVENFLKGEGRLETVKLRVSYRVEGNPQDDNLVLTYSLNKGENFGSSLRWIPQDNVEKELDVTGDVEWWWENLSKLRIYLLYENCGDQDGVTVLVDSLYLVCTFTSFTPSAENALPDGTYYWRVVVKDGAGNENTSENRWFLIDTVPPGKPTLVGPSGVVKDDNCPSFEWLGIPDASGTLYQLEVYLENNLLEKRSGLVFSEARISLPKEGRYSWRVKALDRAGNEGEWSDNLTFIL
ncbi:MAG: Ig-like domain-containing protein, partial [Candidatus Hadarchaeales archaeon]